MRDAWQAYLRLALGLTDQPRQRAVQAAAGVWDRGRAGAVAARHLVGEVGQTVSEARPELARLLRYESERALGAVGLATTGQVGRLADRVAQLERRLRESPAAATDGAVPSNGTDRSGAGAPSPASGGGQR